MQTLIDFLRAHAAGHSLVSVLNVIAMVLACFRLVELFAMDRITEPIRKRFPSYLLNCVRCLSVWAGIWVTVAYMFFPLANWPFAIAWLYLHHNDFTYQRRLRREGRQLIVSVDKDNNVQLVRSELSAQEMSVVLMKVIQRQAPAHSKPTDQARPTDKAWGDQNIPVAATAEAK